MRNIQKYQILPRADLIRFKELIEIRYFYDTHVFIVLNIMYNNINCFIFSQKSKFDSAKVANQIKRNLQHVVCTVQRIVVFSIVIPNTC